MSRRPTCRLIVDDPRPGDWNMAVDEALLESTATGGTAVLRIYRWAPATLSLGYFQRHTDRSQHSASQACPLVRRQTGGGAILHDRELTYSICLPADHTLAHDSHALYCSLHQSLIAALAEQGVDAGACEQAAPEPAEPPFLCFQRRAEGDVLLSGAKIAGSAQRRRRGAVLQHGSLLLATSLFAPELPGIEELTPDGLDQNELVSAWIDLAGDSLNVALEPSELTQSEHLAAERIAEKTYRASDWTYRR